MSFVNLDENIDSRILYIERNKRDSRITDYLENISEKYTIEYVAYILKVMEGILTFSTTKIEIENNTLTVTNHLLNKKTFNYTQTPLRKDYLVLLRNIISIITIITDDITTAIIYNSSIYSTNKKVKDVFDEYIIFDDDTFLIFTQGEPKIFGGIGNVKLFEGKRIFTLKELYRDELIFYEYKIGTKRIIVFRHFLCNRLYSIDESFNNVAANKEEYILMNEETCKYTKITKNHIKMLILHTMIDTKENTQSHILEAINNIKFHIYSPLLITLDSFNEESFKGLSKFFGNQNSLFKFIGSLVV